MTPKFVEVARAAWANNDLQIDDTADIAPAMEGGSFWVSAWVRVSAQALEAAKETDRALHGLVYDDEREKWLLLNQTTS